jgi:hypothetical protein
MFKLFRRKPQVQPEPVAKVATPSSSPMANRKSSGGRGRKKAKYGQNRQQICVALPPALLAQVDAAAERAKLSRSAVVGKIVEAAFVQRPQVSNDTQRWVPVTEAAKHSGYHFTSIYGLARRRRIASKKDVDGSLLVNLNEVLAKRANGAAA